MKKIFLAFVFGIFISQIGQTIAADFPTEMITQIPAADRFFSKTVTISAGQSLYSRLTQVVNSNPPAGSDADKIKDMFTKTVPANKTVPVTIYLIFGPVS